MAAAELLSSLSRAGATLACAESLTGGALAAEIVSVPGASAVFRGGVVAYASDVKHSVLGVDAALLAEFGAVNPMVAAQLATGARRRLGADCALSTTGVAGPDPSDGVGVGVVFLGFADPFTSFVYRAEYSGSRAEIRAAAVADSLRIGLELWA